MTDIIKKTINQSLVISALLGSLILTSCEKGILDLQPADQLSYDIAFLTPSRCEMSMVGAYDAAQCGLYTSGNYERGYPFGGASIIQGEMRGDDMNLADASLDATYSSLFTTATSNNVSMWNTSFDAINIYNVVMRGEKNAVTSGIIDEAKGNQYEGECLFLRALTYHNLMVHFSLPYNMEGNNNYGMPIYLSTQSSKDEIAETLSKNIGRSTVAETYKQIISDLDKAELLLPESNSVNSITRATKGAAIALKTRVYLHMRNWDKVINEAKKLVLNINIPSSNIGGYALETNPEAPFISSSNNKESIFSIENSTDDNASTDGSMFALLSGRRGSRTMCPTSPSLYNTTYWLVDDARRTKLLYYNTSLNYYFCDKYRDDTQADFCPIIRYAEVLLNYSEAALRKGDMQTSLALLNSVRNRSLANPSSQGYKSSDFANIKSLFTALMWERRIEFQGEGLRWLDIHRLAKDDILPSNGIPAKLSFDNIVEWQKKTNKSAFQVGLHVDESWMHASAKFIPCSDKKFLWPIPNYEIIRNKIIRKQQNFGW